MVISIEVRNHLSRSIVDPRSAQRPYAAGGARGAGRVGLVGRRIGSEIEMVAIPAGKFIFQGVRGIYLPEFRIGKFPVTNGQYDEFLIATSHPEPREWGDDRFGIKAKNRAGNLIGPDLPVVSVSWHEAEAFAEWKGGRLPTELEWEKAARGEKGNIYPWGRKFDPARCVLGTCRTRPVSRAGIAKGASPYGVMDMAGNVFEWTSSWYGEINFSDQKTLKFPESGTDRVMRGGSWSDDEDEFGCMRGDYRAKYSPDSRSRDVGFRLAGD